MDKSKPTQRPDLFPAPLAGSNDSRRILANLENSGKAYGPGATLARLRPGHLVLGLTLLAVLAAAVACFSYVGMAPAQHKFAPGKRQPPLVTTPAEVERMAAVIVNEALPAISPAARTQPATVPMVATAGTSMTAADPPVPAKAARGKLPAAQARMRSQASVAPIAAAKPRVAEYASGTAPPARFQAAAAQPDSDVALLAALVAHTEGQASAAPMMHTSRDVVEPREGDSADALLRRCQRLGGAEAGMCRARICDGRWLHEAACRAPPGD